MRHHHDPAWCGVVVVLVSLLSASAAHAAAGGGAAGPGGLLALLLMLAPAALLFRIRPGPVGLLAAGTVGQLVGHVGLGVVTPSAAGGHGAGAAPAAGALDHAHHGAPDSLGAAMDAAGGWGSLADSAAHLAHMGPGMAAAPAPARATRWPGRGRSWACSSSPRRA